MDDGKQQLAGKTCIITGGAGSIGLATARLFVEHGARVMLVDLNEDSLRKAAAGIGSDQIAYAAADVGRAADVQRYVDAAVGRWGVMPGRRRSRNRSCIWLPRRAASRPAAPWSSTGA